MHAGKRLCITGIPTSGKSYLAKKLAEQIGGKAILLDDFRGELSKNEHYNKWLNFYIDQNEKKYYTTTSPENQWKNLVQQSEELWPGFLEYIHTFKDETKPVIFECVNLLPHLVQKDLSFPQIVLIGTSYANTLSRIEKEHRWGTERYLHELEACSFFINERPHYKEEAQKFGLPFFESADDAFETALKLV
ncbi:MAG: hypothetical protein M3Q80_02875, partial [bacterium]|nr:hypothetical protein [bacterium]